MPHVVIDPRNVHDRAITITDPQTLHHLLDVLRVTEGERVDCVDGAGRWYTATSRGEAKWRGRVEGLRRELILDILEQGKEPCSALAIRLVQTLIKPERFDWLVQKATELGVERMSPVITSRSLIRVRGDSSTRPSRISGRMARWRRIATEAAQQCGRATVPRIDPPAAFEEVLASLDSLGSDPKHSTSEASRLGSDPTQRILQSPAKSLTLLPTLTTPGRSLREVIGDRRNITSSTILIGPEGDFTQGEVALAQRYGAVPVSLGRRTLRSETAAIAVLVVLQHTAGEL